MYRDKQRSRNNSPGFNACFEKWKKGIAFSCPACARLKVPDDSSLHAPGLIRTTAGGWYRLPALQLSACRRLHLLSSFQGPTKQGLTTRSKRHFRPCLAFVFPPVLPSLHRFQWETAHAHVGTTCPAATLSPVFALFGFQGSQCRPCTCLSSARPVHLAVGLAAFRWLNDTIGQALIHEQIMNK